MRSCLKLITAVALAVSNAVALKDGLSMGILVGGPHGDFKTNLPHMQPAQTMKCIKIRTGKRLDAISLDVVLPNGQPTTFYHGGDGGTEHTLTLADGEYVETIEYHTGKKNGHTRIFYIKLSTNKGNFLEGGTQTRDVFVDQAPLYYQLGGFQGFSKDEVDMLSSIWSSTRPIPPLPVPSGDASQKEPY